MSFTNLVDSLYKILEFVIKNLLDLLSDTRSLLRGILESCLGRGETPNPRNKYFVIQLGPPTGIVWPCHRGN